MLHSTHHAWKGAACVFAVVVLGVLGSLKSVPSDSFGVLYNWGVIEEIPMRPGVHLRPPWKRLETAESTDNLDSVTVCEQERCLTLDAKMERARDIRYWNHVNMSSAMVQECANNPECPLKRAWLGLNTAANGKRGVFRLGAPATTWKYESTVYEKAIRQAYFCVVANNYAYELQTNPQAVAELALRVARKLIRFSDVFILDSFEQEFFTYVGISYSKVLTYAEWSVGGAPESKINQECSLLYTKRRKEKEQRERNVAAASHQGAAAIAP
jgi:hypothetical protein